MDADKKCRKCGEAIKDKGVYPSRVKKYDWICKGCCKELNRYYHHKQTEKRRKEREEAFSDESGKGHWE